MQKRILIWDAETLSHESLQYLLDDHGVQYAITTTRDEFIGQVRANRYFDAVLVYTYNPYLWQCEPEALTLFFSDVRRRLHDQAIIVCSTGDIRQRKALVPVADRILRKGYSRAELIHSLGIAPRIRNGHTMDGIHRLVSEAMHLPPELLLKGGRKEPMLTARWICMYLARAYTVHSLAAVGTYFGNRGHVTVMHACQTVMDRMDTDEQYRATVHHIEGLLQQH